MTDVSEKEARANQRLIDIVSGIRIEYFSVPIVNLIAQQFASCDEMTIDQARIEMIKQLAADLKRSQDQLIEMVKRHGDLFYENTKR